MKQIINYIFFLLLILLGITFACLNAETVNLKYYIGKIILPLSLLLIFTLGLGLFLGLLLSLIVFLRLRAENHRLTARVKLAEKEIDNLRAIPLHDQH
jgi:putative membrane protein